MSFLRAHLPFLARIAHVDPTGASGESHHFVEIAHEHHDEHDHMHGHHH